MHQNVAHQLYFDASRQQIFGEEAVAEAGPGEYSTPRLYFDASRQQNKPNIQNGAEAGPGVYLVTLLMC